MLLTEDEEERGVRLGKINYFYIFIGANCIFFLLNWGDWSNFVNRNG